MVYKHKIISLITPLSFLKALYMFLRKDEHKKFKFQFVNILQNRYKLIFYW